MSSAIPITTEREQVDVCSRIETASLPIGKGGSWLVAGFSAVLGAWGFVCLIGGLFSCTSVATLREALVMMLTGM